MVLKPIPPGLTFFAVLPAAALSGRARRRNSRPPGTLPRPPGCPCQPRYGPAAPSMRPARRGTKITINPHFAIHIGKQTQLTIRFLFPRCLIKPARCIFNFAKPANYSTTSPSQKSVTRHFYSIHGFCSIKSGINWWQTTISASKIKITRYGNSKFVFFNSKTRHSISQFNCVPIKTAINKIENYFLILEIKPI